MTEPTPIDALRVGFRAISHRATVISERELESLRLRVCGAVSHLKRSGTLPGRVVVVIREIAHEEGVTIAGNKALERITQSCIDTYYVEAKE